MKLKEIWQHYIETRDPDSRKQLIEHYSSNLEKHINKVAEIFRHRFTKDEVMSDVYRELILAIDNFDHTRKISFARYLSKRVDWLIMTIMRRVTPLSKYEHTLLKQFEAARFTFIPGNSKKIPTDEEICVKLGITLDKLEKIKQKQILYTKINCDDEQLENLMAKIAITHQVKTPDTIIEQRDLVQNILEKLSDRDKQIFVLRYFKQLTHKEIGKILNLSTRGIDSILRRQKQRLRDFFKNDTIMPKEYNLAR